MVAHVDDSPNRGRKLNLAQSEDDDAMVDFDLTPNELREEEVAQVESILASDAVYSDFDLVLEQARGNQHYTAPDRDFPPPLAEIREHYAALLRSDAARRAEISESDWQLVDEEADLRLYRVRHNSWDDEDQSRSIIVSIRDGHVLG